MSELWLFLVLGFAFWFYMIEGLAVIKNWWSTYRFRKQLDNRDDFPADPRQDR